MLGYAIELQKDGRGEDAEMVRIKTVAKAVTTDKKTGKPNGMFPLKAHDGKTALPCLKVKVGNGDESLHFAVMWSNYYLGHDLNCPGKFKVVKIETGKPLMLYVTDLMHGRKLKHKMNDQIDYVGMALKFGSTYENGVWNWGEDQAFEEKRTDICDSETVDGTLAMLANLFGDELAIEILSEFASHDLLQEYVAEPDATEVANTRKRLAAA